MFSLSRRDSVNIMQLIWVMILFADTFLFSLLFFPCVSILRCLLSARWDRKQKKESGDRIREKESKAKQQHWRLEWAKSSIEENLIYFFPILIFFRFLYLESWNNKSRDIYTILGVGTSLQPWGMFWFVFLSTLSQLCDIYHFEFGGFW